MPAFAASNENKAAYAENTLRLPQNKLQHRMLGISMPPPSSAKNVPITRGNVPKKHTFPRLIGIFPLYPLYPLSKKNGLWHLTKRYHSLLWVAIHLGAPQWRQVVAG